MLDDDKPDYFLAEDEPEQTPASSDGSVIDFGTPGQPARQSGPDTPHTPHSHRVRNFWLWTGAIAIMVLGAAFYLRFINPYAEDARLTGYVVNVEKRGIFFKTYEAQVVEINALRDTTRIYSHPEQFSIPDEAMARKLQDMQGTAVPVDIHFEKYYATLPWRGASRQVVTSIDTPAD